MTIDQKPKKLPAGTLVLPVNSPRAKVSPCPTTAHLPEAQQHKNRRIYSGKGNVRHCKCNDCGETWKMIIDQEDDYGKFLRELATSLDAAPVRSIDGQESIVFSKSDVNEIVNRLMEIVTANSIIAQ